MAEEPIIEMASGKPASMTPTFSGMVIPAGGGHESVSSLEGPKTVPLHPGDMKKLDKLLREEEETAKAAQAAQKRRDRFCLDMEKEYGLMGFTWKVNFKTKQIEILSKREPEQPKVIGPAGLAGPTGIQG